MHANLRTALRRSSGAVVAICLALVTIVTVAEEPPAAYRPDKLLQSMLDGPLALTIYLPLRYTRISS